MHVRERCFLCNERAFHYGVPVYIALVFALASVSDIIELSVLNPRMSINQCFGDGRIYNGRLCMPNSAVGSPDLSAVWPARSR